MKKILVIRFSSIGDIVLTSPVVRCLKQQIPNCEIHYAVKKSFSSILISNPYVDKVHVLDKNERDFISQLKKEKFDLDKLLMQKFINKNKTRLSSKLLKYLQDYE